MLKHIISFSLWGDNPKYTIGAIKNAELAQQIYPGWDCYFFTDNSLPSDIKEKLLSFSNVFIINTNVSGNWSSMFWRFETTYDPTIAVSIFRDTDSRLSLREKAAVEEWLSTDKTFHIMRDHPYHRFAILGGMWGMRYNPKYDMKNLLNNFNKHDRYGIDYEFFHHSLYPMIGDDKVVHDEFFDKKSFPTKRIDTEFVGDVFDENDNRHPEYYKYI